MLFDDLAEFPVDFRFVRTVASAKEEAGATADEALILVRPLDDLQIAGGLFPDCIGRDSVLHGDGSLVAAIARCTSFS